MLRLGELFSLIDAHDLRCIRLTSVPPAQGISMSQRRPRESGALCVTVRLESNKVLLCINHLFCYDYKQLLASDSSTDPLLTELHLAGKEQYALLAARTGRTHAPEGGQLQAAAGAGERVGESGSGIGAGRARPSTTPR